VTPTNHSFTFEPTNDLTVPVRFEVPVSSANAVASTRFGVILANKTMIGSSYKDIAIVS
jgi:hypothetical protein